MYNICKLNALLFFSQKYFPMLDQFFQTCLIMSSPKLKIDVQIPSPGEADTLALGQASVRLTVVPSSSYAQARTGKRAPADLPILLIGGKCIRASQPLKLHFPQVIAYLNSNTDSSELTVR